MKRIVIILSLLISIYWAQEGAQYLIIAHGNFYDQVAPLALWKNQKGIKTVVKNLSEVGSTPSQIKSYITNAYNTWSPRPEYLLLVGSPNLLPSSNSTDDYYANLTGDYQIELCIGRFHCATLAQCSLMVAKSIGYEKSVNMQDSTWYGKGTTIVGEDNPQDPYYQADTRFIRNLWLGAGYSHVDSFISTRNHNQDSVINAINNGRAFVVYRGQSVSYWWSPFNVNPNNTNNGYKLPVVVSGTCATVTLTSGESMLADNFLRAGTVQNPKGAVGYFGTTLIGSHISQYRGTVAKGFFRALYQDSIITMGGAAKRAKFIVDSIYHVQDRYREWNLLGDPELNLWTATPKMLSVSYDTVLPQLPGQFSTTVLINGAAVPNARVCIWKANDFYLTANTDSQGFAAFDINPQTEGGFLVTVTGRNCYPFQDSAWIQNGDVGVIAIYNMPASVDSGLVLVPGAMVKNFGNTSASFPVRFTTDSYSSTRQVTNLFPESTYSVEFDSLYFVRRGENICQCSTELAGDENSANDWVFDTTFINVHDVGVTQILSPEDSLWVGDTVLPVSDIHNFGNNQESFSIRFWISADSGDGRIVYDSVLSMALEPDQDTIVSFPEWIIIESGNYSAISQTELINDMNPGNDSLAKSIIVIPLSGVTKIFPTNEIFGIQSYPNPFLNDFTIEYGPIKNKDYWLKIYDVAGELVKAFHLVPNENQTTIVWDGKNSSGLEVNQGIYFMQLQAPAVRFKKKLLKLNIASRGNFGGLTRGGVR